MLLYGKAIVLIASSPVAHVLSCFSHVQLGATPWTVAPQVPPSMRILQARKLEWVAMPVSRGSFQPRKWTHISCLLHWQKGPLPLEPPGKFAHQSMSQSQCKHLDFFPCSLNATPSTIYSPFCLILNFLFCSLANFSFSHGSIKHPCCLGFKQPIRRNIIKGFLKIEIIHVAFITILWCL